MAKTLSLAMKIFADAGGVVEKLSPVQKALQQLDAETAKVTDVFKRFGTESATAAATQEKFETRLQALNDSLRAGLTNPQDYARSLKQLQAAANEAAGDLDKAARVIEANLTREQRAQRDYATQTEELNRLRSQGLLTEEQYATALQRVSGDYAKATLAADNFGEAAFREGAALTEANRTQEEKRAAELARLNELLQLGAINQETFNRASMEASGASDAAKEAAKAQADAEKVRTDAATRAAAIVEANLTKEQKAQRDYGVATRELNALRNQGLLTEQEYAIALQRVSGDYAKATLAADKFGEASGKAGDGGALKFNELSGVLSVLPGPIGNVAGRLSGLASAGEGLSRVFSGGLSQGISSIGASIAGLVNPFTLAVAGVAAFGAAATAIARGLTELDDRVEKLGNTADKLGVSFEFIQTLEAAAARSGTSIEAVSAAFGRLQKSITGADEESKAAQAALQAIGVTAEELKALKPEDQYKLIGERLQAIQDPAARTAASIQLFGKSGADLLPFFKNIGGAAADMERFGRALTDLDRRRIDDFGAGLDALQVATQGLGQSLLLPFTGLGDGIATALAEITAGITAIVDPIGQVLEPVFTGIGRAVDLIGTNIGNLGRVIGAVLEPFATVVQGIAQAFEPLQEGVLNFFKGISDSAVQVTEFVVAFTPIGVISDNIGVISETLSRIVTIITTAFSKAVEYVSGLAEGFGELISSSPLLETLGGVVQSVFGGISDFILGIVSGIGTFVDDLLTIAEYWLGIDRSAKGAAEASSAATESTAELSKEAQKAYEQREKTFQKLREEVNDAIDDSRKFGAAGREAALSYEASIEQLKQQLSAGLIDDEQFRRSVRIAGQVFDEELKAIEDRKQIEIKVTEDAAKAIEKVGESIDKAAIKAEDLGAAGTNALGQFSQRANELRSQFAAGIIDDKQLEKGVEAANRQYEKQLEAIKAVNAERQKQIEEDRKRSEALLDEADRTRSVQRDREAVEREMARLRAEAARQRFFTPEQRQQLLELAGLQEDLAEKQRAVAQGFEKGYAEAFDKTKAKFQELAEKSREFGAEGERAAKQLAAGLFQAQQAAAAGTISRESYEAEVARQQRLYDEELKRLKAVADERLKTNQMVDEILLLQSVGGDSQRAEAKKKLLSIEEEMLRVQQDIAAARKADDTDAIRSGTARLAQLDQAAAVERDIASGQAKIQQDAAKRVEEQQKQAQQVQEAYAQEQARIFEEQRKAAEAESQRQEKRLRDLNTLGQQSINVQDVRTTEGANLVIQTATRGQDPAAIQARLQTKYLEQIAAGILQASRNYFNAPVSIVGAGSFGDVRS